MEKELNKNCLSCGLLMTQMKETSSDSYRQYNLILQILIELERKGEMDLPAGGYRCSVGSRTALYRLPLYAVPQLRSPLFCGGLHSGRAGLSAGGRHQEGKPRHPAVGPVWNLLFTEKRLKEA